MSTIQLKNKPNQKKNLNKKQNMFLYAIDLFLQEYLFHKLKIKEGLIEEVKLIINSILLLKKEIKEIKSVEKKNIMIGYMKGIF